MFFVLEFEISLAALLEISSICKLSQKCTTSLISVTLFLLEGSFFPVDLLTHFLNEAEEMVALQTFSESVSVTMIRLFFFSSRIFLRTQIIKLNGGKEKPYSLLQGCRNASFTILPWSSFQAMHRGS